MKTVLVTGGAGFIGSHTVLSLCAHGYNPVAIDNLANSEPWIMGKVESLVGRSIPFYSGDVRDRALLEAIFHNHGIDAVIHFAADKAVGESVNHPLKYYDNNLGSLVSLLSVMDRFGVRDLVFSSSCTVYGEPDELPVSEKARVKSALSPYGNTKQIGEEIIRDWSVGNHLVRGVLLRYFNPIGAHPSAQIGELPLGTPNNLVPFITQTAAGIREKLTIFGNDYDTPDGTCIRDYIHVTDLADAHVQSLHYLHEQNQGCIEVFNVGTGKGTSVMQAIEAFQTVTGISLNYGFGARRDGDVARVWADAGKIDAEMGWRASRSLEDCMRDAWNWQLQVNKWREDGILD